jgi:hypothetical protein
VGFQALFPLNLGGAHSAVNQQTGLRRHNLSQKGPPAPSLSRQPGNPCQNGMLQPAGSITRAGVPIDGTTQVFSFQNDMSIHAPLPEPGIPIANWVAEGCGCV